MNCQQTAIEFFFAVIFALIPLNTFAQDIAPPENTPPPVLPNPEEKLPIDPLPPLEEVLPAPETTPPGSQLTPEQIPGTIILKQIKVEGSTVFSQEELAAILKPYTLRPVSFAELLEAQTKITQLYADRGYITSGAFIPPQIIEDRVIRMKVIEGLVESINVSGLKRLDSNYISSRLENATDAPLNREKLLQALQLLQLDPLIARLSAELEPGISPGRSILSVRVKEANAFDLQVAFDNNRSPSVGTNRRIIRASHGNFLGFGDRISLGYVNTDGSDSLDDFTYTIPLNSQNGTFSFTYLHSNSEIIEEPFNILDIQSTKNTYQATYRQPLYQTATEDFALGFTFTRDESETTFDPTLSGESIPFYDSRGTEIDSRGVEPDGQTKISALRFFQEYTSRNRSQVFALRSQFSFGIDAFDSTISNDNNEPDSKFLAWRGQAQYLRLLSPETTLLFRLDTQLANNSLVPLEQFSLGGAFTVRGYRQDILLADNGIFASAEIRYSVLSIPDWETTLQLTPFIDFGNVWNKDSEVELAEDTLLSLGIGLRLLVSDFLTAKIDWGIPLIDLDDTNETLQENGIHFSIEANL
jgi:hemolysin activation/secretion protein